MEIPQNSVYINRRFNCSASSLFKWVVEPELVCQWFGPNNFKALEASADLRVGGIYDIQLQKPNGDTFSIGGEYLEISRPNKLVFSLRYKGVVNSPPESTVKITIEDVDTNIAELSFVQKFENIPKDMAGRTKAWQGMFTKLNGEILKAANKTGQG